MTDRLCIALAQCNLVVGDLAGNLKKHIQLAKEALALTADVIVFPELSLTGYPPEDLLYRHDFIEAIQDTLETLQQNIPDIYCVVGHPLPTHEGLQNACSVFLNGKMLARYAKQCLPNQGVFDEKRYFVPGKNVCVLPVRGIPTGLVICEDLWHYGPVEQAAAAGARLILSPNASPFETDKHETRQEILANRARNSRIPIVYVNFSGGQDESVFDGGSLVMDSAGTVCQCAGFFQENLLTVDLSCSADRIAVRKKKFAVPDTLERIYSALVTGTRDYLHKNHLPGVIVGVSGGIDSALTLAVAHDALGKDQVHAALLPSRHTSTLSMEEALLLVDNLDISHEILSIEPVFQAFLDALGSRLENADPVVIQNIQARCRGTLLMALSNQSGKIVLTTGNRSELAVGYATLYGDMAGGFSVLKDIPKTLVYELAHYRNTLSPIIPERTLMREPTAELAPNQKDTDTLPPYNILDRILERYINDEESIEQMVDAGFDQNTVKKVIQLIRHSEYKRRQAPPGVRIRQKAFGRDRRYPLTSGWKK